MQCTTVLLMCGTVWTDSCVNVLLRPVTQSYLHPVPLISYRMVYRHEKGGGGERKVETKEERKEDRKEGVGMTV